MSCKCQVCNTIIDGFNGMMVMLKDDLWLKIANKEDILCTNCIEEKLGRKIEVGDFKAGTNSGLDFKIPVNMIYAEKNGLKY